MQIRMAYQLGRMVVVCSVMPPKKKVGPTPGLKVTRPSIGGVGSDESSLEYICIVARSSPNTDGKDMKAEGDVLDMYKMDKVLDGMKGCVGRVIWVRMKEIGMMGVVILRMQMLSLLLLTKVCMWDNVIMRSWV
ncbi:hypothetical protein Syun_007292 [Stephania yunnanensis]|uniref:Uncharacterized protein n=1 Tax=Stephania yunnanensis TaxID=152371 RepID=A0AAP0KYH8_9MAGN